MIPQKAFAIVCVKEDEDGPNAVSVVVEGEDAIVPMIENLDAQMVVDHEFHVFELGRKVPLEVTRKNGRRNFEIERPTP